MKIGILSFHAAHNYGSMLQNYALQQAIKTINPEYDVITINLRNKVQEDMYNLFKPFKDYTDKKRYIIKMLLFPWKEELKEKYNLFEKFLEDNIRLSSVVDDFKGLVALPQMDAYVTGSDQIWNLTAKDFDWAYFLDFVDLTLANRPKLISYAPSMGPAPSVSFMSGEDRIKLRDLLRRYDHISVREERTAEVIKEVGEFKTSPQILPDPTLLLSREQWKTKIRPPKKQINGKYIFLYNPYYLNDVYHQASILSALTGLKVVVSNLPYNALYQSRNFVKILATGPQEFLWLIENAEYVIGRSFHLAVFSLIFQKKFIAVEGLGDSRLGNFLKSVAMEGCATSDGDLKEALKRVDSLSPNEWNKTNGLMGDLREEGYNFLKRALL